MANIKLSQAECRRNLLPDVCMFCGEQSTERKQKTFAWQPQWVWLLILASPLIAIIVAAILTKRMTVHVPVCEKHEGYWRRKTLILLGSFLLIAVVCIGGFVYMANQGPGPKDDLTGWVCGGGVVLFFIWLVAAAIYSANGIRPSEITDRSIRMQGVNEHFVAALEDDRDRDREEEAEYRRKRRAERELEDRDRDGERDRVRDRERDRDRDRPRSTERRRDDDDDLERRSRG